MYRNAIKIRRKLEKEREAIEGKLAKLPLGDFKCYKNGKYFKWYIVEKQEKRRTYLHSEDRVLAEKLAQRGYLESKLDDIKHEIEALNRYIRYHRKDLKSVKFANKNSGYLALVQPLLELEDAALREWATKYKRLDYKMDQLKCKALDGNFYRSKSEAFIATRLYERGIAFRYECAVQLEDGRTVYPDFVIKHPRTGELYIWEHLGMMDVAEYRQHNVTKIMEYMESGYQLGRNLILTTEDEMQRLDIEEVDRIIEWYFA